MEYKVTDSGRAHEAVPRKNGCGVCKVVQDGIRIIKTGNLPIRYIQVFGERNSGTNFLSKLLRENMEKPENFLGLQASDETPLGTKLFGYKHWFIAPEKFTNTKQRETLFVVIYRNPYTWIRAMMERPYALSKSISNQGVAQLPGLKLVGHINGKDTENEFHPETGEKLDIFALRRLKIKSFESLRHQVDNVAFVNMEALLADPDAVMRSLVAAFDSGFVETPDFGRAPPKVLTREYTKPMQFTPLETEVLNKHIDWRAEAAVGYWPNSYDVKPATRLQFVILHGSSSVGKTYSVNRLLKERPNLIGMEMDDCRYWDDYDPKIGQEDLLALWPDLTVASYQALTRLTAKTGVKAQRNMGFLFEKLKQHLDTEPQRDGVANGMVVATCGALPFPAPNGAPSIYTWLEALLPVTFHHLLIEIPENTHLSQIEKRGRSHLKDEILANYLRRQKVRNAHDRVVSGYSDIVKIVDEMTAHA